jgi:pimeloyl-ACP methyl ester carboxylesterase
LFASSYFEAFTRSFFHPVGVDFRYGGQGTIDTFGSKLQPFRMRQKRAGFLNCNDINGGQFSAFAVRDGTLIPDPQQSLCTKAARLVIEALGGFTVEQQDESVILVGHSFGGITISEVAEMVPDRIEALIYVAAYMPRSGDSLAGLAVRFADQYAAASAAFTGQHELQSILAYLEQQKASKALNNPSSPRMVSNYVFKLSLVIFEYARLLKPGAPFVIVNDNVRYGGEAIILRQHVAGSAEAVAVKAHSLAFLYGFTGQRALDALHDGIAERDAGSAQRQQQRAGCRSQSWGAHGASRRCCGDRRSERLKDERASLKDAASGIDRHPHFAPTKLIDHRDRCFSEVSRSARQQSAGSHIARRSIARHDLRKTRDIVARQLVRVNSAVNRCQVCHAERRWHAFKQGRRRYAAVTGAAGSL